LFCVVCFLMFVSRGCLLFFKCGVKAYYCFHSQNCYFASLPTTIVSQFPFTVWLLFLCATIATCFRYLLLHTSIVIVLYLYVIKVVLVSLFAFCRSGFRIWCFSCWWSTTFFWHDFFVIFFFLVLVFFNTIISLLLWLYLVSFYFLGFVGCIKTVVH